MRTRYGHIVWLTGLSGAGKTTLSRAIARRLLPDMPVEILDGDEVRAVLSQELTFTKEHRDMNVLRIGYVARLLARQGIVVVAAAISPYRAARQEVRRLARAEGINFVEVFLSAGLETLIRRDVKGLYRKALAGEIRNFTGINDPYEPPEAADVVIDTERESVESAAERIISRLSTLPAASRPDLAGCPLD